MRYQLVVAFAASLRSNDGNGVRLCRGIKEIPKPPPPAPANTIIAGFSFRQYHDPLVYGEYTAYFLEPTRAVRYDSFTLNIDSPDYARLVGACPTEATVAAGVLVSEGKNTVLGLINRLRKQNFVVLIGNEQDGGFNPYHPTP